ncbi:MAG: hypothetical protein ABR974_05125 [Bacteroidales bacterium]|jgi:hypothetical protein
MDIKNIDVRKVAREFALENERRKRERLQPVGNLVEAIRRHKEAEKLKLLAEMKRKRGTFSFEWSKWDRLIGNN